MAQNLAKYNVGDLVRHKQDGFRGVIVDVDPVFAGPDRFYARITESGLLKDIPWYHVLVDADNVQIYVPEVDLKSDWLQQPIEHPFLEFFFSGFDHGHYITRQTSN